jgi:hypothetical protein
MAKVVQFVGIESTIETFVNSDAKFWSLWVDRQMLFSFVGENGNEAADALQQILERLEKNRGIYTLKIYRKLKDPECISEKDPCHGSFNFRMMPYEGDTDGTPYYKALRDELTALKAERETLLDELGERDDDGGVLGKLGSMFLEDPAKLPLMVQSIQGVLNMFTSQTKPTGQQQPVALSGINDDAQLNQVIETLKRKDPELLKHLQKLASMPDPLFKQLIGMLESF